LRVERYALLGVTICYFVVILVCPHADVTLFFLLAVFSVSLSEPSGVRQVRY